MDCVSPPALDDQQLLEFLNGEGPDETASHLERCSYCRDRASRLARVQNRLRSLYRVDCPSSTELGDFHLRLLPADRALILAQHLRGCPHCRREVAQLAGFVSDLTPASEEGLLGWAKTLTARLIDWKEEPGLTQAVPVLRGEGRAPITLEADGIIIVLDVQAANEGTVNILGQVAADDQTQWTGAQLELRQDGREPVKAFLDDLGAFDFKGILQGSAQITLISPNGIIIQSPIIDITT